MRKLNESYNSKTIKDILTNSVLLKYTEVKYRTNPFDYRSNIIS